MTVLFVFSVILACLIAFHKLTAKYLNPYKLTMIFGKKGSGKSTLLTKLALQYQAKGIPVYSTEAIPGCYVLEPEDIGFVELQPESVLLVDEVGMIWDNRGFKTFKPEVRDWFKLQRHRRIRVYLFSQTFDVDKKIRDLTDEMYLVQKRLRVFSYAKRILRRTVLNKSTAEAPAKIDEDLVFVPFCFSGAAVGSLLSFRVIRKYFDRLSVLRSGIKSLSSCRRLRCLRLSVRVSFSV